MSDLLSDVLRSVRLKGGVFLDARFTSPWCVYSYLVVEDCRPILQNPQQMISYHYVTEGRMLISTENSDPMEVNAGEIVMLPRNDKHILSSSRHLPPIDGKSLIRPSPEGGLHRVIHGGGGAGARLICGFLGADDGFNPLIATLPPIIKVDVRAASARGLIESSMEYAATELAEGRVASPAALAQLSELLFVEAVRRYAAGLGAQSTGWLRGLADAQVGKALALLHQDMQKDWTVEDLARAAALSRSAFMNRFTELVGMPPMAYLTNWRLSSAKHKIADGRATLAQIAHDVGYESEDSFSRAFKREFGVSPAKWRSGQQASVAAG